MTICILKNKVIEIPFSMRNKKKMTCFNESTLKWLGL